MTIAPIHRQTLLNTLLTLALLAPVSAFPAIEIGQLIRLGDDIELLQQKLRDACDSIAFKSVTPPSFPLAQRSEQHLICDSYSFNGISFDRAAFTLADDRFVRMEAVGIDVAKIREALGTAEISYLDLDVFAAASYWLNETQGSLIWIDQAGLHSNLFAWQNPYLDDFDEEVQPSSTRLTPDISFTTPIDEQLNHYEDVCSPLLLEKIDEIWLRNAPLNQQQVNCFNLFYAGFPRKFELVYGDGNLQVIWVLTGKPEEQRLRNLLIEE